MNPINRLVLATCAAAAVCGLTSGNADAQRRPPNEAGTVGAPQESPTVDCTAAPGNVNHVTMDHSAHLAVLKTCRGRSAAFAAPALPTMAGQAAFGAIGEIVRILEADPGTDWSKVNIEALRQHLIDMDEVVLRADITQQTIEGGIQADVTGQGRTAASIKRVVLAQSRMLDVMPGYRAEAEETASGARVVITARDPGDARTVARIRGLGFAGLMTEGDHHVRHHIAIARGEAAPHAH
jgi:hypothetical protein